MKHVQMCRKQDLLMKHVHLCHHRLFLSQRRHIYSVKMRPDGSYYEYYYVK
jgi:hypothetical protein